MKKGDKVKVLESRYFDDCDGDLGEVRSFDIHHHDLVNVSIPRIKRNYVYSDKVLRVVEKRKVPKDKGNLYASVPEGLYYFDGEKFIKALIKGELC